MQVRWDTYEAERNRKKTSEPKRFNMSIFRNILALAVSRKLEQQLGKYGKWTSKNIWSPVIAAKIKHALYHSPEISNM